MNTANVTRPVPKPVRPDDAQDHEHALVIASLNDIADRLDRVVEAFTAVQSTAERSQGGGYVVVKGDLWDRLREAVVAARSPYA